MAKKKKTALKPAINRGFATTSTPSKRPDQSRDDSSQQTTGTNTPSEEEKRDIARAIDKIVISGGVNGKNDVDTAQYDGQRGSDAFDPEKEEEQALQNLVDRLQEKVDKEVARVWKNIEFDRRQANQLPIFELDANLQDGVISFYNATLDQAPSLQPHSVEDLSSLLEHVKPASAASDFLQKVLINHALLLRLGFTVEQIMWALGSCQSVTDIDECVAWLASHLSAIELETAERIMQGKPPIKGRDGDKLQAGIFELPENDAIDSTRPPEHEGFTFNRRVNQSTSAPCKTLQASPVPTVAEASVIELLPEMQNEVDQISESAKSWSVMLEDREVIDALEDPAQSSARARLTIIQVEKALGRLEKIAKSLGKATSTALEEASRQLESVKNIARSVMGESQNSRDWNRAVSDRIFVKLKMAWEDEEAKLELSQSEGEGKVHHSSAPDKKKDEDMDELEEKSQAGSDEEGMFGDLLNEQALEVTDTLTQAVVRLRDLPPQTLKAAGSKSPKVLLSDALHRADPYGTHRFEAIATGGRMFRSRLALRWSANKSESVVDTYTMTAMATASQSSAEDILAVAALLCIETRPVYKSLAAGWRDWWDELEEMRQGERNKKSRATYRRILETLNHRLLEENTRAEERKQRLRATQRKATAVNADKVEHSEANHGPASAHVTDENVISMWERKRGAASYQDMLLGRRNLPIASYRQHILDLLMQNQVFVLSGETGCGKSTQVPSYILEDCLSRGQPCKIYVTEPRRISAISLAERVSVELGEMRGAVGKNDSLVGSAVRLESNIGRNARLIYATTGIVLRMLEGSRLEGVTHVILDEVHERSIESDFLLIILRSLLESRPDLKVILMSATLDATRISDYFGGCPTIDVPGRTFPVEVRFLEDVVELCNYTIEDGSPYARRLRRGQQQQLQGNQARLQSIEYDAPTLDDDDDDNDNERENSDQASSIVAARCTPKTISTLDRMDESVVNHDLIISLLEKMCLHDAELMQYSAAILIFLPGIAEIRKLNDLLQAHTAFGSHQHFQLFPLHSTISSENQSLVFQMPPSGVRKIVLSTNIAETGITIPDITCVIDTGKHREMRFDEKRQMSKLVECFVARSNAKQRRGRAGRVQNGLCWHLFTRHRHDQYLAEHPLPEMLRLSLQDLALKLKVMKVRIGSSIEDALGKAMDPPTSLNIQRSVSSLMEIKALTSSEDITPLGRHLARIPLDVHMGKFLLIACSLQILDPALTIAATLNAKSPFLNPFGRELEARNAKKSFDFGDNDFLTIVRAFNSWRRATENGIGRQFCQKWFLSQTNFIQIEELRQQYISYLLDSGFVNVDEEGRREIIGSRFRFNSSKTKFLVVPPHLDENSHSLAMINAALVSALYPKLLVIDAKNGGLKTLTNGAPASIHPSSVNFKLRLHQLPKGINHLVYFTLMQSKRLYAWETGALDEKAVLLMCGDADFKFSSKSMYIDRTRLRLTVYELKTLVVLKVLRERLQRLISASFRNPAKSWTNEEATFFSLACRVLGVGINDKDKALA